MSSYYGAIDQGTSSTRFTLFDEKFKEVTTGQIKFPQYFPEPGLHEHDPVEIMDSVYQSIELAMSKVDISKDEIKSIGITNQRETTVAWDKTTGKPLHNAIVWDDTRTKSLIANYEGDFQDVTGMGISTYVSAPKIAWLLQNGKVKLDSNVAFGTIDAWLVYNLTREKTFATEISNASRMLLMDLQKGTWVQEYASKFGFSIENLPEIRGSDALYGHMASGPLEGVPIQGILGDQQAALLGQQCVTPGSAKCTFGTGAFLLASTGQKLVKVPDNGLLTTVHGRFFGDIYYALEGAIASAGSAVDWSAGLFGMKISELEEAVTSIGSSGGVCFVPALSGLFAPYWRMDARGLWIGMTRATSKEHMMRAVLEGLAFRASEILRVMQSDSGFDISNVLVDGGITKNQFFLQTLSDASSSQITLPEYTEATVLGAAIAGAMGAGRFNSLSEVAELNRELSKTYSPKISQEDSTKNWEQWEKAVTRSMAWSA